MTNVITICGTVTSDIEELETSRGVPIAKFRILPFGRDEEESDTLPIPIVAYGAVATKAQSTVRKNDRLVVLGRLRLIGREDKVKFTEVVAYFIARWSG